MITEFFKGITLCHQASVAKVMNHGDLYKYYCVFQDEIASLEFA